MPKTIMLCPYLKKSACAENNHALPTPQKEARKSISIQYYGRGKND
jgi:hypothetical protein